ncbi:MAG: tetratricopeptide repeat protein [Bacteroidota bacterium]|nr:tetratricopeptide repeat protein [Bacteroidota bacterium]
MKTHIIKIVLLSTLLLPFTIMSQSISDGLKYMEMEQFGNARKVFTQLANSAPQNAENQYYLGDFYIKMSLLDTSDDRSIDSATVCFNKGITADPKFALNYVGLGTVAYIKNNWDESARNFQKAVDNGRKNAQVYANIGEAYLIKGKRDVKVAVPQLEKAAQLDAKNTDIMLLLGDAYLLADEGSGSRAIKQYEMALKANPKLAKAHMKGGRIYLQARNFEEALKYYDRAIEADPTFSPAYRERAELYFKLRGYREKAPAEYKKYLSMSDGNYRSKFRFAFFCFISGDYSDAVEMLQTLFKENPNDRILLRLSAYCSYETGAGMKDTVAAKPYFKSGLEQMNKFITLTTDTNKLLPSDYEYLGKLLIKSGNDSLGAKNLIKVVKKDSTKYEIYNDLAKLATDKKKYKNAAAYYTAYYKFKKPGLNDYLTWGRAYYNAGDFVNADTVFNQIIKAKPEEMLGYKWRALANESMDKNYKSGKAVPHFQKFIEMAIAKDPAKYKSDIIRGYTYMGLYALNQKDQKKSIDYWKKILELDPNDANGLMMKQNLKF